MILRKPKDIMIGEKTLEEILQQGEFFVDLSRADLSWADLSGVNLRRAILIRANLNYANLIRADLNFANLSDATLIGADFMWADLSWANLNGANLNGANLSGARLNGTNFNLSNLSNVNIDRTEEYRTGKILRESIIGYKKCKNNMIVTLEIPQGSIVFSINGTKCRTNKAKVIAIDGADRAYSCYNGMSYYVGDEITVHDFNCMYNTECAEGIHFFKSKTEAMQYYIR